MNDFLRAASVAALVAVLSACGTPGTQRPPAPTPPVPTPGPGPSAPVPRPPSPSGATPPQRQLAEQYIRYRCENGFEFAVTYQAAGTRALVERSGYSDLLRLNASGSGARYSDGKTTLYARADVAMLALPDGTAYRSCRSLAAKAPAKK